MPTPDDDAPAPAPPAKPEPIALRSNAATWGPQTEQDENRTSVWSALRGAQAASEAPDLNYGVYDMAGAEDTRPPHPAGHMHHRRSSPYTERRERSLSPGHRSAETSPPRRLAEDDTGVDYARRQSSPYARAASPTFPKAGRRRLGSAGEIGDMDRSGHGGNYAGAPDDRADVDLLHSDADGSPPSRSSSPPSAGGLVTAADGYGDGECDDAHAHAHAGPPAAAASSSSCARSSDGLSPSPPTTPVKAGGAEAAAPASAPSAASAIQRGGNLVAPGSAGANNASGGGEWRQGSLAEPVAKRALAADVSGAVGGGGGGGGAAAAAPAAAAAAAPPAEPLAAGAAAALPQPQSNALPRGERRFREAQQHSGYRRVVVGICAMDKKARSRPMKELIRRLPESTFEIIVFGDEAILEQRVEDWPLCDCLIAFYSSGFPLKKAEQYARLRRPFLLNDLKMQRTLLDRRLTYDVLKKNDVPTARHVYYSLDGPPEVAAAQSLEEHDDYIEVNGVRIDKPFVEKPVDAEDHNIYIYYPMSAGGGSKRLFRKVGDKSSAFHPECNSVRADGGSYIYEEFKETQGTDVKVYTVGPAYAHSEARKSPVVDGKVMRDKNGREVRYPVILTRDEKRIATKICLIFQQTICGFDLLRVAGDKALVCDVNGWSFVKTSSKYYNDCAQILGQFMAASILTPRDAQRLRDSDRGASRRKHQGAVAASAAAAASADRSDDEGTERGSLSEKEKRLPSVGVDEEFLLRRQQRKAAEDIHSHRELRCVVAVIRHGDRTPKQKMKMLVSHAPFLDFFHDHCSDPSESIKVKSMKDLKSFLATTRVVIELLEEEQRQQAFAVPVSPSHSLSPKNSFSSLCLGLDDDGKDGDAMGEEPSRAVAADRAVKANRNSRKSIAAAAKADRATKDEHNRQYAARGEKPPPPPPPTGAERATSERNARREIRAGMEETIANMRRITDVLSSWSDWGTFHRASVKVQLKPQEWAVDGALDILPPPSGAAAPAAARSSSNPPSPSPSTGSGESGSGTKRPARQATVLQLVLKWGGILTELGKNEAMSLGAEFCRSSYPRPDQGGMLRLHSTFRHDLKVRTSDEGRVLKTAAAFTKGMLELEGDLPPILVSLVHKEKSEFMLDHSGNNQCKRELASCKLRMQHHLLKDEVLGEAAMDELDDVGNESIRAALREIGNPRTVLEEIYRLVGGFVDQLSRLQREQEANPLTFALELQEGDTLGLLVEVWTKMYDDLYNRKKDKFDLSKIPDVYDSIRYHCRHNSGLMLEGSKELYRIAKLMSDVIVPLEYGITREEKRIIGARICRVLLEKVRDDLSIARSNKQLDVRYNLDMTHSEHMAITNPKRVVRTRLYFTSESHLHTMMNVLRFPPDGSPSPFTSMAGNHMGKLKEFSYFTRIVIRLYEIPKERAGDGARFSVEVQFSGGTTADEQPFGDDPAGPDKLRTHLDPLRILTPPNLTYGQFEDFLSRIIQGADPGTTEAGDYCTWTRPGESKGYDSSTSGVGVN